MIHTDALWHDRKRNMFGLPWTFLIYELDDKKLYINSGIINTREDEVRLYRITDMTLTRSLWQRITKTGTIHCNSSDPTLGNFDIKNIKNADKVKHMLSELVESARLKARVSAYESVNGHMNPPPMGMTPETDFSDADGDGIPDIFENPGDISDADAAINH